MNESPSHRPAHRRALLGLTLTATVILAAKVAVTLTLPGPWYLPDEVIYLVHARQLAAGGEVFYQGPVTGVQPLWPAILAPIMAVLDSGSLPAYHVAVILASVLGTLLVFPVFLLSRRWLPVGDSFTVALLSTLTPGICLYGWASLTEPLYTLVLVLGAACFVRALCTERLRGFVVCGVLAAATFWVRPYGLTCVLAAGGGAVAWGVAKRRWQQPLGLVLAAGAVLAAGVLWKAAANPQAGYTLTNYTGEQSVVTQLFGSLGKSGAWRDMVLVVVLDVAYVFVATYAVFLPLALAALAKGCRGFTRMDPVGKGIFVAAGLLFAATYGLTGFSKIGTPELTRMYGRYVEPLLPLVIVIGAVAWRRMAPDRTSRYTVTVIVLLLTVLLGAVVPRGETSFTNNAGLWYWYLIYAHATPLAALAALAALWFGFAWLWRRPTVAGALVVAAAVASTGLVTVHLWRYNAQTRPARGIAAQACAAVKEEIGPAPQVNLWVDPTLASRSRRAASNVHPFVCWLRYGLPGVNVDWARQNQIANVGDLLLTWAAASHVPPVWRHGPLCIQRIAQRRAVWPVSPDTSPDGAAGVAPAPSDPGRP